MFTEREAIKQEMEEIKELVRIDTDKYWEMRFYRNKRLEELLDRLRELDERDLYAPVKQVIEKPVNPETLPKPKNLDMTVTDLQIDRVTKPKRSGKASLAPREKVIEEIELFLKQNGPTKQKEIREHIEQKFNVQWANFNTVLKQVVDKSPHIGVDTIQPKKHVYFYI